MTIQTINIGNSANDGNGEPARSAFNKINQNFTNYSHSASRLVGTQSGNVMEVGAFGVGKSIRLGSQKLLTLRGNGNAFIGKIMVIMFQVLETILTIVLRQLLI